MTWDILFHPEYEHEFDGLNVQVQDEMFAHLEFLRRFGPSLGRPRIDTLKGSSRANMKELRFEAAGGADVWLLRSIRSERPSCSREPISLAEVRSISIGN